MVTVCHIALKSHFPLAECMECMQIMSPLKNGHHQASAMNDITHLYWTPSDAIFVFYSQMFTYIYTTC